MLRRLSRVLRIGLFGLGMAAVAALVLDSFCDLRVFTTWPRDRAHVFVGFGSIRFTCEDLSSAVTILPARGTHLTWHEVYLWFPLPSYHHVVAPGWEQWGVGIPLWLLAVFFLAWPVTSFIVSRRRGTLGFEVEAVGTPLSTPLAPGEVPSPRGGEGGRVV